MFSYTSIGNIFPGKIGIESPQDSRSRSVDSLNIVTWKAKKILNNTESLIITPPRDDYFELLR